LVVHSQRPIDLNEYDSGASGGYFRVAGEGNSFNVVFMVSKRRVTENYVDPHSVNLHSYSYDTWVKGQSRLVKEDKTAYYYEANILEGEYVIALPVNATRYYEDQDIQSNKILSPVIVSGMVTRYGHPVEGEVLLQWKNNSKEIAIKDGRYFGVIDAVTGDIVIISNGNERKEEVIRGDKLIVDIEHGKLPLLGLFMSIPVIFILYVLTRSRRDG
jgi:hypothetical protein